MSQLSFSLGSLPGGDPPPRPSSEEPFEIWVLGDFSGRGTRGVQEPETIGSRAAPRVDRDELESRFEALPQRRYDRRMTING